MDADDRAAPTEVSGMKEYIRQIRTLVDDEDLVKRNRAAIVEIATKLFHKNGYHNTSTRDIAKSAGVSVGSLYQYFRHKEDLMILILQSFVELLEKDILPIADMDVSPDRKMDHAIERYYRLFDENHTKTSVLYHQSGSASASTKRYFGRVEDMMHDYFVRILKEGMDTGVFRQVDAEFMSHNIVSMGHMWALKRRRFRGVMTIADYIRKQQACVKELVLDGSRQSISATRVASAN